MIFKTSIIHKENTKKNHKRVVSLYVIEIALDLHINFNFDFPHLHKITSSVRIYHNEPIFWQNQSEMSK
jgi:hypothetical protein